MNPLSILLAISHCFVLLSASPLPTLSPRSQYCANIPGQVAGTFPSKRILHPRAPAYIYCARGHTKTYVLLTLSSISPIQEPLVQNLISTAMAECTRTLKSLARDGPIFGGVYSQLVDGVALWVRNSNNHQLTWGVLGNALAAVGDYFEEGKDWGAVQFAIWDGGNEVAVGNIGVVTGESTWIGHV